jgi:hypothetical protein
MLDHEAEAVAARTLEAPVTAGAGVQSICIQYMLTNLIFISYGSTNYYLLLLRSFSRSPSPVDERYVNLCQQELYICETKSILFEENGLSNKW